MHGTRFIDELLDAGYEVILRPHPQSFKFENVFITSVINHYKNRIHIDCSSNSVSSMLSAGMLISDASGIRMDFALTQSRPVLTLAVSKADLVLKRMSLVVAMTRRLPKKLDVFFSPEKAKPSLPLFENSWETRAWQRRFKHFSKN